MKQLARLIFYVEASMVQKKNNCEFVGRVHNFMSDVSEPVKLALKIQVKIGTNFWYDSYGQKSNTQPARSHMILKSRLISLFAHFNSCRYSLPNTSRLTKTNCGCCF